VEKSDSFVKLKTVRFFLKNYNSAPSPQVQPPVSTTMKVQSGVSLQEKGREVKGPPTKNTKFEDVKKDVTAGVKRGSGETILNFFHKFDN
jgi:hypothetical protein